MKTTENYSQVRKFLTSLLNIYRENYVTMYLVIKLSCY